MKSNLEATANLSTDGSVYKLTEFSLIYMRWGVRVCKQRANRDSSLNIWVDGFLDRAMERDRVKERAQTIKVGMIEVT
jgi:hypothetical protein